MSNIYVKGRKNYQVTRSAKTFGEDRLCEFTKCKTVLSKYNKQEFCFLHSKKTFGRNRGWKQPS